MPRTSVTSEFTTDVVNKLQAAGIFESIVASGNTVKAKLLDGFEFAFSPRSASGRVAIGESKYSKESCISALARFISETGIQSSSKYNSWAKSDEEKENKTPSTHAIMITLGVWPAQTITRLMLTGKINEVSPDEIVEMQNAYNEKAKAERPAKKENEEVEVNN